MKQKHRQTVWNPHFHSNFLGYESICWYWEKIASRFLHQWPRVEDFNELALNHTFHFIEQTKDTKYETETFINNRIPMRLHSWHDFFNNITWLLWPRLKRAIIERIGQNHQQSAARTSLHNMLTHFDECGIIICSHRPELFLRIEQFLWQDFFLDSELTKTCKAFIFGHGIMEKALNPYIGLTAKALFLPVDGAFFDKNTEAQINHVDNEIALRILGLTVSSSPQELHPFPLLGWPNWWPSNSHEQFLSNKHYFRPKNTLNT